MTSLIRRVQAASCETKLFIVTVVTLAVIVLGSFVWAFTRIDSARSGKQSELVE